MRGLDAYKEGPVGHSTVSHGGSEKIVLVPVWTRNLGDNLGILGIRRALSCNRFRCKNSERESKWYVEPISHNGVDNENNGPGKEVFILPAHF